MSNARFVILGAILAAVIVVVVLVGVSWLNPAYPLSPPSEIPPAAPTVTRVIPNG